MLLKIHGSPYLGFSIPEISILLLLKTCHKLLFKSITTEYHYMQTSKHVDDYVIKSKAVETTVHRNYRNITLGI